jgi:hypothetical protein
MKLKAEAADLKAKAVGSRGRAGQLGAADLSEMIEWEAKAADLRAEVMDDSEAAALRIKALELRAEAANVRGEARVGRVITAAT